MPCFHRSESVISKNCLIAYIVDFQYFMYMKSIKKLFIAVLTVLFVSLPSFAEDFDWSQCWCTYGAGIKEKDLIVDIGTGINWKVLNLDADRKNWFVPAIEVSVEVPVKIWKLPLSFGGSVSYQAWGYKAGDTEYGQHDFTTAGMVNYHFHLPPENLDVYAGLRIGFGYEITDTNGNKGNAPYFYSDEVAGATWYFNDDIGLNVEFGYPIAFRVGVSLKR